MICSRCLRLRPSSLRHQTLRQFTNSTTKFFPETSTSTSPSSSSTTAISTPSPTPSPLHPPPAKKSHLPVSSAPQGTILKGINYLKAHDDPVALKEDEYPEWLWHCLDEKKTVEGQDGLGDEFSKSKKLRRKAAKAKRLAEERAIASGDLSALQPKIPITQQSIDLGSGEEALGQRADLRRAMRGERRAGIKEANYLKGM